MFKLLFMLQTGALLLGIEDAHAQAKALPGGSTTAMPVTRVDALVVEGQYYAGSFSPLRDDVRDFERDPANRYTYCIRNVATYECLSYASDGSVRRRQHRKTAHGTGFAYQHDGEETRILTNEHVVFWPYVTDPEHREENVPLGCKLVNQKLHIVDNEDDAYEGDDIALTHVIDDRALDVAVVRAKGKLRLLPYRIGSSSALAPGNVVIVRGFPLGVFAAYNTGKIVNTLDRDRYKHWHHADFIIDAQLSSGNSGSPVLALNQKTGEYELVGAFHASYSRGSSLNAVISVEQLRELMFQLKRSKQPEVVPGIEPVSDTEQRARLLTALADKYVVPYVGLGSLLVRIYAVRDSLLFEIFSKRFPLDDHRVALLLDAPTADGSGKLQQVWLGNDRGYRNYSLADLEPESATSLKRVLQRLYDLSYSTIAYRQMISRVPDSRQAVEQRASLQKNLARVAAQDSDLVQLLIEVAMEKSPTNAEMALGLADVFSQIYKPVSPAPSPPSVGKTANKPEEDAWMFFSGSRGGVALSGGARRPA